MVSATLCPTSLYPAPLSRDFSRLSRLACRAIAVASVWGILAFSLGPKPSKKVALLLRNAVRSPPPSGQVFQVVKDSCYWSSQNDVERPTRVVRRFGRGCLEQMWLRRRHLTVGRADQIRGRMLCCMDLARSVVSDRRKEISSSAASLVNSLHVVNQCKS